MIESVTLVRFVDTDVYLVEKQTVIMQLLYVTRWKRELATSCFIKGACTTLHLGEKVQKFNGNWYYPEFKGQILLMRDEKPQICLFPSKSLQTTRLENQLIKNLHTVVA